MHRTISVTLLAVVALVGYAVFDWYRCLPEEIQAAYVGTATCIECHQREASAWRGSHHDLAMDVAGDSTVLGDFENAEIEHYGITSRLYRDGNRFMVQTEGADGDMSAFEVSHVFGAAPLQQYLVEVEGPTEGSADGALGRLQVLPFCWDVERGRWYYLSPPDVDERLAPDDPLHWTGYAQNWNHMCAACHATDLRKGFDLESNSFATTYSDIDVGCEACHGPGSTHVQLASARSLFWDRRHGKAITKFTDSQPNLEFETCGPCHSHRQDIYPGFAAGNSYYDHFVHASITPDLYYADGQIRSEVYVLGSYMQSKMFAKGIRCSACHDPHSSQVKFNDNRLCTSCHQHPAAKYDTPAHHQHEMGSVGAACVECHMPETPFMEIDLRRDHSMKIPRPDRSVALGVPNACTGCHLEIANVAPETRSRLIYYADWLTAADEDEDVKAEVERVNQWAADKFKAWYGDPKNDQVYDFAATFHAAWQATRSESQLADLAKIALDKSNSAIVRASALDALQATSSLSNIEELEKLLTDRSSFVRASAVSLLGPVLTADKVSDFASLLADDVRMVRVRAAVALASVPPHELTPAQRRRRDMVLEEYRDGLLEHSDQGGSHLALGTLAERSGADREAVQHYLNAIKVQPTTAGPRSNLANVLQRLGAEESAAKARAEELPLLRRDAALVPGNMAAQYRFAMALYLAGNSEEAEQVLLAALERDPSFGDARYFLALLYDKQQRQKEALKQAQLLLETYPSDPRYRQLLQSLSGE